MVPSPPATSILLWLGLAFSAIRKASCGPFDDNSTTCNGCKIPRNVDMYSDELLSPDFAFAVKLKCMY